MALFNMNENETKVANAIVSFTNSVRRFVELWERLEKLAMKEIKKKQQ